MSSVEFLDGDSEPGPPHDQYDPHDPHDPNGPAHNRRRTVGVVLAVVALVAAGLAWVLTRPADEQREARSTPRPTQAVPSGSPLATEPRIRDEHDCHGAPFCALVLTYPKRLTTVINDYLPDAGNLEVRSYVAQAGTGAYLSERQIQMLLEGATVRVSVRRDYGDAASSQAPPEFADVPSSMSEVTLHVEQNGFIVYVQYLIPNTQALNPLISLGTRSRLIHLSLDPALLSL